MHDLMIAGLVGVVVAQMVVICAFIWDYAGFKVKTESDIVRLAVRSGIPAEKITFNPKG